LVDTVVSLPDVAMTDPWLFCLSAAGAVAVVVNRSPRGAKRTAVIALGVATGFLLIKAALGVSAFRGYRSARDARAERVDARVIEATWASLTTWNVLDRTPRQLRFWRARAGQAAEEVLIWPLQAETPVVKASRSLSTVRNFLRSHELTFAAEFPRAEDRILVLWSDIRFCWNPDATGAPRVDPIVEAGRVRLACALWFGGELDSGGVPLREIVKIGGLTQARDPKP
jgi:hypothetical protein